MLNNLEETCYCIECSKPVRSLIKKYKDGFIDLIQCVREIFCLIIIKINSILFSLNRNHVIKFLTSTWNVNIQ